jgi:NAD/NADP transhydrogenase alpha subunit
MAADVETRRYPPAMSSRAWDVSGLAVWCAITGVIELAAVAILVISGALVPALVVLVIAFATGTTAWIGFGQQRK